MLVVLFASACSRTAPEPLPPPTVDAGRPDAARAQTTHAPPLDMEAAEDFEHRLGSLARSIEARLLALPLVHVTRGGFGIQPFLRVSISQDAIALDDIAMLQSWRSQHLAGALAADASGVEVIDDRSVIALMHGELPASARGSTTGDTLPALDDVLHRVRRTDELRRRFAHGPRWNNVDVFVGPDILWRTVFPVLHTLTSEGFEQHNLVARRDDALVVRAFNVPDSEPPAPTPVLPLTIRVRSTGWQVLMGGTHVGADCRHPGPAHIVAPVARHPDVAALTTCMVALRQESDWHERLSIQRRVQIDFDGSLSFADVHSVITAVEDSPRGSGDLFTNPVLGMLR